MPSDSFCGPYKNPRTGRMTYGGAARNGRIKTLGGMDSINQKITNNVIAQLINEADNSNNDEQQGTK